MFQKGKWMARPPDYPPIMNGLKYAEGNKSTNISNLEKYIDMMPLPSSDYGGGGGGTNDNDNDSAIEIDNRPNHHQPPSTMTMHEPP